MRLCIIFLLSLSMMVAAEMNLFAGGRNLANGDRFRRYSPYNDYDQIPLQNRNDYIQVYEEEKPARPDFTYRLSDDDEPPYKNNLPPFAVPPSSALYFENNYLYRSTHPRKNSDSGIKDNRISQYDFNPYGDDFTDRRVQRQNPNLAANKFPKFATSTDKPNEPVIQKLHPFGSVKDIPTSLVPSRHNAYMREILKNHRDSSNEAMNIYVYAMIASVIAAVCVISVAFGFGWYTIHKKMKAAADAEYPAYGVTGPNSNTSPSGDRRLAHSAQLYHYQHQKQQILAMEKNINERNGSVSDPESEDENEEGDYTVYECPGFATTGELEVKNPLFLDEPTPATPATVVKAAEK